MSASFRQPVSEIEVVEDLSASARCDEGFLRIRRLRCRNIHGDGTASKVYRVDVVDRPTLDAVAVAVFRRQSTGIEVMTRRTLRPAAYFRRDRKPPLADEMSYLRVEEIVAGVLEPEDNGQAGILARAAAEVREEAGFAVAPDEVMVLGAGFFAAPGIISEKIYPTAVDVTGKSQAEPEGDGSPLEEGFELAWTPIDRLIAACESGQVPDAKTEIAVLRLQRRLSDFKPL